MQQVALHQSVILDAGMLHAGSFKVQIHKLRLEESLDDRFPENPVCLVDVQGLMGLGKLAYNFLGKREVVA